MNLFILATFFWLSSGKETELFDVNGKVVLKSFLCDWGYREDDPGFHKTNVDADGHPAFVTKENNPQFGFAVDLMKLYENDKTDGGTVYSLDDYSTLAVISGPGNPGIEYNDAGFVEFQSLHDPPTSDSDISFNSVFDSSGPMMWFTSTEPFDVQSSIGASLAAESWGVVDGKTKNPKVYFGASTGLTCTDTISTSQNNTMYNFGKMHSLDVETTQKRSTRLQEPSWKNPDDFTVDSNQACRTQGNELTGEDNIGLAQGNRNLLGFSIHLSKDKKFLLTGAPLLLYTAGTALVGYRDKDPDFAYFNKDDAALWYFLCASEEQLKKYAKYGGPPTEILKMKMLPTMCAPDTTFGYAVASAVIKEKDQPESRTYLVVSAPRANGIHGVIRIFYFDGEIFTQNWRGEGAEQLNLNLFSMGLVSFMSDLKGTLFNSGFGTTMLGIDLNGDGTDELLVGEPYYTNEITDTFNAGRILVFVYNSELHKYTQMHAIQSPKPSSSGLFGYNLASVGDTNDDGGEDFMVSAIGDVDEPVRIYSGRQISGLYTSSSGEKATVMQVIPNPEQPPPEGSVFGFSMGQNRVDLDGNGFNDFIVGDPYKTVQQGYVFYANTYIRLVYPDMIKDRYLFPRVEKASNCPSEFASFPFCQPITVIVENRGVHGNSWNFSGAFNLDLQAELTNSQDFKIDDSVQTVEVLSTKPFKKSVDFFVYGDLKEAMGEHVKLVINTNVATNTPISLVEQYKGQVEASPETSKYIDLAIGRSADVSLNSFPTNARIVLGSKTLLPLNLVISANSGKPYLVSGEVMIRVSNKYLSFSSAQSNPNNYASCSKDLAQASGDSGSILVCKVINGKEFSKIDITLNFEVEKIASGAIVVDEISVNSMLTWSNRENTEEIVASESTVSVVYDGSLEVNPQPSVLAENAAFPTNDYAQINHLISFENSKTSEVGRTKVMGYLPFIKDELEADLSKLENCKPNSAHAESDPNCSVELCNVVICELQNIKNSVKTSLSFDFNVKSKTQWKKIISGKFTVKSKYTYEVTNYAYGMPTAIPQNNEGEVEVVTTIRKSSAPFPWWIVIVTLIVCILLVVLVIVVLFKKGFFKKRDPNKIRVDLIKEDEAAEEENKLQVHETDFGA